MKKRWNVSCGRHVWRPPPNTAAVTRLRPVRVALFPLTIYLLMRRLLVVQRSVCL
ncbi:MAG: hypothetical protein IJP82_07820 [Bacteroidaceae bacterium]|nr:hypothetical protein [Bacteroidaceae bacterium]